ncbi:MAG: hypothetical protein K0R61_5489 [Microvirga sp.]|nr:hypothetical protein [Microvirga sp.]
MLGRQPPLRLPSPSVLPFRPLPSHPRRNRPPLQRSRHRSRPMLQASSIVRSLRNLPLPLKPYPGSPMWNPSGWVELVEGASKSTEVQVRLRPAAAVEPIPSDELRSGRVVSHWGLDVASRTSRLAAAPPPAARASAALAACRSPSRHATHPSMPSGCEQASRIQEKRTRFADQSSARIIKPERGYTGKSPDSACGRTASAGVRSPMGPAAGYREHNNLPNRFRCKRVYQARAAATSCGSRLALVRALGVSDRDRGRGREGA